MLDELHRLGQHSELGGPRVAVVLLPGQNALLDAAQAFSANVDDRPWPRGVVTQPGMVSRHAQADIQCCEGLEGLLVPRKYRECSLWQDTVDQILQIRLVHQLVDAEQLEAWRR